MLDSGNRDAIAIAIMPNILAQLFTDGMPESNANIFQLAAARAYLGADALITESTVPKRDQPTPVVVSGPLL